jgi:hypothetical protein
VVATSVAAIELRE